MKLENQKVHIVYKIILNVFLPVVLVLIPYFLNSIWGIQSNLLAFLISAVAMVISFLQFGFYIHNFNRKSLISSIFKLVVCSLVLYSSGLIVFIYLAWTSFR
jgi:hypothetical protein